MYLIARPKSPAPTGPRIPVVSTVFWVLAAVAIMTAGTYSSEVFYRGLVAYRLPLVDIRISLVVSAFMAFLKFTAGSMYSRVRSNETGALRSLLLAYIVFMTIALVLIDFGWFTLLSFDIEWPWPDEYAATIPYWLNGWLGLLGAALALATVLLGYVTGAITRTETGQAPPTTASARGKITPLFSAILVAPFLLVIASTSLFLFGNRFAPPSQREATYLVFVDATATWNNAQSLARNEAVLLAVSQALVQTIEDSSLEMARIRYFLIDDNPALGPFCSVDFRPTILRQAATAAANEISNLRTLEQYLVGACVLAGTRAPQGQDADFRATISSGVRSAPTSSGRKVLVVLSDLGDETPLPGTINVEGYEVFLFYRMLPGDSIDVVEGRLRVMRERLRQGGATEIRAAPDTAISPSALAEQL